MSTGWAAPTVSNNAASNVCTGARPSYTSRRRISEPTTTTSSIAGSSVAESVSCAIAAAAPSAAASHRASASPDCEMLREIATEARRRGRACPVPYHSRATTSVAPTPFPELCATVKVGTAREC